MITISTATGRRSKLFAGLIFGLLLVLWGTYYFRFAHPVGTGPAGPSVNPEAFAKPWTTRSVLLVGIGDSVTAGFGAGDGYAYFERLIKNPPDEFADMRGCCLTAVLPNLSFTNISASGSTSLQHTRIILAQLKMQPSNVLGLVVMTTGGNDLIHNYGKGPAREGAMYGATYAQAKPWIDQFETRLTVMVQEINGKFLGGCHIFLANIYDPTDGVGDIQVTGLPAWPEGLLIHQAYNRIIADCARKNSFVHLVDIHEVFLGHGLHCTHFWCSHYDWGDPHYWYHDNLEDPNERGYDAIRRQFLNAMIPVFTPHLNFSNLGV